MSSSKGPCGSSPPTRPIIIGLHHLKFAVSNPSISIAWYERVLGARHITSLDHLDNTGTRFAAVCQVSCWGNILLELRQNAAQAAKDCCWDPVTMSIAGRDELMQWMAWLDHCGTAHSPALVGTRGWILVFQDPDGRRFRLYTREEHGGQLKATANSPWLDGS